MTKKIYLIINAKEEFKDAISVNDVDEIKQKVQAHSSINDLFIVIRNGVIDDIISYAEINKYNILNCGKTYILNKCFQDTAYATFGENISHEAINKFEATDNGRYFFLCSNGKINSTTFEGKDYVFTTQNIQRSFLLSKAELISYSKYESGKKSKYAIIQKVKGLSLVRNDEDIRYNGEQVYDIFRENTFIKASAMSGAKAKHDDKKFPCATFKGEEVKKPEIIGEKLFDYDMEGMESLSRSSMRQFVFEGTKLYNAISGLLNNTWVDDAPLSYNVSGAIEDSVLSVIGKQDRETYFSSLIAYAFQHSPSILKAYLDIDIGSYSVYREEKNVDILIRSNNKIIIIENKIDADFSVGTKKWFDFIDEKEKDPDIIPRIDSLEFVGKTSQLEKYYRLARYYAEFQGLVSTDVICYILCPKYKEAFYNMYKEEYATGKEYQVVSYEFLAGCLSAMEPTIRADKKGIIQDLQRAIKMYTFDQNTYYMDLATERFINRIKQLKEGI